MGKDSHFTKNLHLLSAIFMLFALSACGRLALNSYKQPTESLNSQQIKISLDGEWQFHPASASFNQVSNENHPWEKIHVPQNWYLAGYDINGEAWYAKTFYFPQEHINDQVQLKFLGVDYQTQVWLNNKHLGEHTGYFQSFQFNVSKLLKPGMNRLLVKVDSPLEKSGDFSLRKRLLKGVLSHHDTRPGGAWSERGEEHNTGGIWNSVFLNISKGAVIDNMQISAYQKSPSSWQVKLDYDLLGDIQAQDSLHWRIRAYNHDDERIIRGRTSLSLNQNKLVALDVSEPKKWWPVGYGEPNLYQLTLFVVRDDEIISQHSDIFGFRKVETDENGVWFINDQRMILKGSNYISSQWLSEMTRERYHKDVQLMLDAHINVMRVHAHIESKEFYRLCDEMGLMLWQDYVLQWGYSDDPIFHQEAESQLKDMLQQFRNHPSIIMWTMHNEPPWDSPWMQYKYPDYDPLQNKELDEKLYTVAKGMDDTRPVQMISAGTEHPWYGWYTGHWLDYGKPAEVAWVSEYGAQALPIKDTLQTFIPQNSLWPDNSSKWQIWDYHNFQQRENFEMANIEKGSNIDEFIRNSQSYQSNLIQLAAESYRRQAYKPIGAMFHFMFVENWPSINWGVVDYLRTPKAGYYALQRAYQPILPSLEWEDNVYKQGEHIEIGIWGINDSNTEYLDTQYELFLYKNGTLIDSRTWFVDLPVDSRRKITEYLLPEQLPMGKYVVRTHINSTHGNELGNNVYIFDITKEGRTQ